MVLPSYWGLRGTCCWREDDMIRSYVINNRKQKIQSYSTLCVCVSIWANYKECSRQFKIKHVQTPTSDSKFKKRQEWGEHCNIPRWSGREHTGTQNIRTFLGFLALQKHGTQSNSNCFFKYYWVIIMKVGLFGAMILAQGKRDISGDDLVGTVLGWSRVSHGKRQGVLET